MGPGGGWVLGAGTEKAQAEARAMWARTHRDGYRQRGEPGAPADTPPGSPRQQIGQRCL